MIASFLPEVEYASTLKYNSFIPNVLKINEKNSKFI